MPSLSKQEAAILEAARAYAEAHSAYMTGWFALQSDARAAHKALVEAANALERAAENYGV